MNEHLKTFVPLMSGIICLVSGLSFLFVGTETIPRNLLFQESLAVAIQQVYFRESGVILVQLGSFAIFYAIITYPFDFLGRMTLYDRIGIERLLTIFFLLPAIYFAIYSVVYAHLLLDTGQLDWLCYNLAAFSALLVASILAWPFRKQRSVLKERALPLFSDLISNTRKIEGNDHRLIQGYTLIAVAGISIAFLALELALSGSLQYVGDETLYLNAGKQMIEGVKCNIIDNVTNVRSASRMDIGSRRRSHLRATLSIPFSPNFFSDCSVKGCVWFWEL